MGYAISSKTVYTQKEFLDKLLNTSPTLNEVSWVSSNSKKLAYRLFNAFKAAEVLNIKPYNTLKKDWRIVQNGNIVTAERINRMILAAYRQAKDVFDVIDYIDMHENIKYPVMFPEINQDNETLTTLYTWAKKQELGIYLAENSGGKGVILAKDISDKCWTPDKVKKRLLD